MDNVVEFRPKDPVTEQIMDELKKLHGNVVGKRFTVNGEVLVANVDGVQIDLPLEADALDPLPERFGPEHREVMETMFSAVSQINANPKRIVPVTRVELLDEFKANAKVVGQLERWGFLRQRLIKLVPADKPRQKTGTMRAVYYFTPQGRAYVRREFDAEYGKSAGPVSAEPGPDLPEQVRSDADPGKDH